MHNNNRDQTVSIMFEDKTIVNFPMESVAVQLSVGGFVNGGAQLKFGHPDLFQTYFYRFSHD